MSVFTVAAFCGIVFASALVQGISGFAYTMVALTVFPFLFGYTKALALAALLATGAILYNAWLYRSHIEWRWVWKWLSVYLVADLCGVAILRIVGDAPIWYTLLGLFFIMMTVYLLWGEKWIHVRVTTKSMVVLSILSGLFMGIFCSGGPVMAAFFLEATKDKAHYLGTSQFVCSVSLAIDFLLRALNGMFTADLAGFALLGIVPTLAGLYLARGLVRRLDARMMRRIICVVIALDGVVMLFH